MVSPIQVGLLKSSMNKTLLFIIKQQIIYFSYVKKSFYIVHE